jgi:hypothetical protein
MPYDYEHIEEVIMDATQRGAFNSFIQSTWAGNPNDIIRASVQPQPNTKWFVQVTGTKLVVQAALPDPPFEVIERVGANYRLEVTERGALNTGGQTNLETFIATVWPGAVADVTGIEFLAVQDEDLVWQMRVTLRGNLTAATGGDLPAGKRFRVKKVT